MTANGFEWMFFDVGNIIISDYPSLAFFYWELSQAIAQRTESSVDYEDLLLEREELALNGQMPASSRLARKYLATADREPFNDWFWREYYSRYDEFARILPGIKDLVDGLKERTKLGIVANQPKQCVDSLKRHGLWDAFSVHGISAVVGHKKPDPEIFSWACREADTEPHNCLMIGDRLDNNIAPAREVGMKTVWVDWQNVSDMGLLPEYDYEAKYFESVDRLSARQRETRKNDDIESDYRVRTIAQLAEVLAGLADGSE